MKLISTSVLPPKLPVHFGITLFLFISYIRDRYPNQLPDWLIGVVCFLYIAWFILVIWRLQDADFGVPEFGPDDETLKGYREFKPDKSKGSNED